MQIGCSADDTIGQDRLSGLPAGTCAVSRTTIGAVGRPPTKPRNPGPIGENLKRLREERALSQEALAKRAGVSRSTVASIEAGKYPGKDLETLEGLADGLGVPVAALLQKPIRPEHIAAFMESSWYAALAPNATEITWLSSLPDQVYFGADPTPETMADLLRWWRVSQKKGG